MKNIKDKKTEAHLDSLILSLTKNKITKSIRKETEFKLGALFVYLLMIKVNIKKKDNNIKKKLSKKSICIYMAEQIKEFRMLYLYYKKNKYPRMEQRKQIGLDFYNNIVCDKQKNWEAPFVHKKLTKHCRTIYTIEDIEKKKYKIKISK
jgi:RNA-binding protein YhbY